MKKIIIFISSISIFAAYSAQQEKDMPMIFTGILTPYYCYGMHAFTTTEVCEYEKVNNSNTNQTSQHSSNHSNPAATLLTYYNVQKIHNEQTNI